jgi:signal transduction histidine kinase
MGCLKAGVNRTTEFAGEQKESGEAQLLHALFAHSGEPLLLLDRATGRILDANAASCRLLGHDRGQLVSSPAAGLDTGGALRGALERLVRSPEWKGEVALRAKGGRVLRCDVSLVGVGRHALAFLRHERAELQEREKADRMKDEFLATLSHELRTPLNAILGWAQTLQAGDAGADTLRRALAQIESSAKTQSKLIDDLLYVSDIVAGRLRLEVQPMRLGPAVAAVVEALHPAVEAKGIELASSLDSGPDVIVGDPVRVQQIAWNLLSNAVKFTPVHGRIEVAVRRSGFQAELRVTDSGDGISADFLPHVFDRFRQADASSRKRHGGLGLGLSIARYLTEMHGGSIEASSPGEGQGATFVVRFPLVTLGQERIDRLHRDAGAAAAAPAPRAERLLAGFRVLTVDDDRNTREMLREALRMAGADVEAAGSVREALERLPAFRPDVVVSDIGMPEEDGFDLVRRLRALPPDRGGDVPAIALTGFARDEDRAATRRAGYQAVAPKPVNLTELIATIRAVAGQIVA